MKKIITICFLTLFMGCSAFAATDKTMHKKVEKTEYRHSAAKEKTKVDYTPSKVDWLPQ